MSFPLFRILAIDAPERYKLHLACWNQRDQPLDVFVRSREEWDGWNRWRSTRDDFSREFIFSLIEFYHQSDTWLFGGIFVVLSRRKKNHAESYEIARDPATEHLVGRLKVRLKRPSRSKAFNLENYLPHIEVSELLPQVYTGAAFAGFDSIDLPFPALTDLVRSQRQDWKAALANAKGVYLVTDTSNGKRYVGSAYGTEGIWSRWECYVGTGHGYNDDLTRLIREKGISHAQDHFRFALLEHFTARVDDALVLARESWWKQVLLTRGTFGYNKN